MRAVVARLFLLLPGWWMFWFDNVDPIVETWTLSGLLIASFVWYGILWAWDQTRRRPRCPISVMLARLLIGWWIVGFVVLTVLPVVSAWRFSIVLATIMLTLQIGIALVAHGIGHFFIYPNDPIGNYYTVRRAGWHPFWDRLWPIFNPDSDLIRDGGFEEPEYTGFVPPADWQHQCPVCGARQPFEFGVCWLCGYGADGDSTAYYERWGDVDSE